MSAAIAEVPAYVESYGGASAHKAARAVRDAVEPLGFTKAAWAEAFVRGGGLDMRRAARLAMLDIACHADSRKGVANWGTRPLQDRHGLSYRTVKRGLHDAVRAGWVEEVVSLSASRNVWRLSMAGRTEVLRERLLISTGRGPGGRPRKLGPELVMLRDLGVSEALRDELRVLA